MATTTKTKSKGSTTMAADEITPEPLSRSGMPLRLRRTRREAAGLIRNQLKIGHAIGNQRMSSHWDLDQARTEKQEWVQRTSDLLTQLFSDASVAEQCNEWYGTVLPEYAELELFIEQFEQEMKTRLGKLQNVLKMLDNLPEPPSTIGVVHAAHLVSSSSSSSSSAAPASPNQVESAQLPPSHLPPAAELKAILKSSESSAGAPTAAADAVMRSDETANVEAQPEEDLTTLWQPPPAGAVSAAAPTEEIAPAAMTDPEPIPAPPTHQAPQPKRTPPMQAHQTRHAHSSSSSSSSSSTARTTRGSSNSSNTNGNGDASTGSTSFNAAPASAASSASGKSQRAMLALVMHGQVDPARRDEVEKLLEALGLSPVIVERVSAKTFAIDVASIDARGCAVLLLGDSMLDAQDADADPQPLGDADADGDIMFVLGCSVGRFGGRICVLQASNDSQRTAPTLDRAGFTSLLVDGGEGWKLQLARQLKATGLTVDLNRLV